MYSIELLELLELELELLSEPHGTQLYQLVYSVCILLLLPSLRLHSFSKLLRSAPFYPIPFSDVVSYVCNIFKFSCNCLHSILGYPHILNACLKHCMN